MLAHYRKAVSSTNIAIQFVLPESMRTLPLMILSLLRTPAFDYIENHGIDERVATLLKLKSCSFPWMFMRTYPRMYKVSTILDTCQNFGTFIDNESDQSFSQYVFKPVNIASSISKINSVNAYLVVSCDYIYLYLPPDVSEMILFEIFGKSTLEEIIPEEGIPTLETEGNARIRNVIEHFRKELSGAYQQVIVAPHNSPQAKYILRDLMTEDAKNPRRELTSVQFLSYLHKMVLSKTQTL